MNKILYAINFKQAEEQLSHLISSEYIAVGAVTYREAILDQIDKTGADTVLLRETLPGSMSWEKIIKQIRLTYPSVRIVMICEERPKKDPFLQMLVGFGIYDIINSDRPKITEMSSFVMTPRTYRDAAQYGIAAPAQPEHEQQHQAQTQEETPKKGGFFNNLKSGISSLRKQAQPKAPVVDIQEKQPEPDYSKIEVPQVNIDILRSSIEQSATQKAQQNMDALIEIETGRRTAALETEIAELRKQLMTAQADANASELHTSDILSELNEVKAERDDLKVKLQQTLSSTQKSINVYEEQLKALQNTANTPKWYKEQSALWESQKESLTTELEATKRENDDLAFRVDALARQVTEKDTQIKQLEAKAEYAEDLKLNDKSTDELIIKLRSEVSESAIKIQELTGEIASLNSELDSIRRGGPDMSQPSVLVPLLPDDAVYATSKSTTKILLTMGSKHGVGNTTVALNIATDLAGRGYKTLLVEVNGSFPMLNSYFELTRVPYGFEECINAISVGKLDQIDRCIIRPHGTTPIQAELNKVYKKLPSGLHFMLFSNESLKKHSYAQGSKVTEATLYTLLNYLVKRMQYSHIILDIQSDDYRLLDVLLNSGYHIDKLCMVLSQDAHALMSAGNLINVFAKARVANLVGSGVFVVNRYNTAINVSLAQIEKTLRLAPTQLFPMKEDTTGYYNAAANALPYIINNGKFRMDYTSLRSKVAPGA